MLNFDKNICCLSQKRESKEWGQMSKSVIQNIDIKQTQSQEMSYKSNSMSSIIIYIVINMHWDNVNIL